MKQRYEIVIQGHLAPGWAANFVGLEVICQPNGSTLLCGDLPDQPALYGLILQLRDLGFTLVSVRAADNE